MAKKSEAERINQLIQGQRNFFESGKTRDPLWRKQQLQLLSDAIHSHEQEIFNSLKIDLSKSSFESFITEVGMTYAEINNAKKHVVRWSRPKTVIPSLVSFPAIGKIIPEPFGISLIMSPWNYPFALAMEPLIGAIVAGNCALIKPSRYSMATSAIIEKIITSTFPPEYIAVIQGGHEQNTILLEQHFDFIFFTGSVSIGKIVMENAARFLTPVCLELGGKSPCVIDKSADIEVTARRLVWGKCINAGQTCVAPDYALVHESIKKPLIEAIKHELIAQYGTDPLHSENFCKIINEKHFQRLSELAPQAQKDEACNKIAPTFIELGTIKSKKVSASPLMQEEIFGPILPIITYTNIDDVVSFINNRNKPLALYLFTKEKNVVKKITTYVQYGGGCINDVIFHVSTDKMPFGGIGESGMGRYHGKASFDTFTHFKSVMIKPFSLDLKSRFAPYNDKTFSFVKKIIK